MEITGKKYLEKLKHKNKGNLPLVVAVDTLLKDLEEHNWKSQAEIMVDRPDADCVHNDGFYFFDINVHRVLILIEFEDEEASIVWCGAHDEYENTFKNNKNTIRRWLKAREWIK